MPMSFHPRRKCPCYQIVEDHQRYPLRPPFRMLEMLKLEPVGPGADGLRQVRYQNEMPPDRRLIYVWD